MEPIFDECGFEQGGKNSSDFYQIYINDELETLQASNLGVQLGPVTISCLGQADDVALTANYLNALQSLLGLALSYCRKYQAQHSPGKTKLLAYSPKNSQMETFLAKTINPIYLNEQRVEFVEQAEHVGTVRFVSGNLPHILYRLTAHRRSLFVILLVGLARGHRGNPASALRAYQIFGTPVLFSGFTTPILFDRYNDTDKV